jgi:hypothetical protein
VIASIACVDLSCQTGADAIPPSGAKPPVPEPPPPPLVPADKVDLLLMIDNSASMADKQVVLADAVPTLIVSLLKPRCVDASTGAPDPSGATADPAGSKANRFGCPAGTAPEHAPIGDMHIGIISSSLGSFGGDICADKGRQNDRAHLLNVTPSGTPIGDASPASFLSWYPLSEENADKARHPDPPTTAIGDTAQLADDFASIVTGVGQTGCGLEAQMESWYRFLVQPDPWVEVKVDSFGQGHLGGPGDIDYELLAQRADFLRPDSLLAVVLLTDEDDSSVDPLSVGGTGWGFMALQFPGSTAFRTDGRTTTAPRGTSACATDPSLPDCTSCGFAATCDAADAACAKLQSDPECQTSGGYYGPEEDQLNARFGHQLLKRNYGVDPQYPISRYTDGLTKAKVPNRSGEHDEKARADGQGRDIGPYLGTPKCTNPLFAATLPRASGDELCDLPRGGRSPGLVFFAVIGGVPGKLLHFDASDPAASRITADDWVKILGRDPAHYDYAGLDPHMIESKEPRRGLAAVSADRGDDGADPVHGREWDTGGNDLQYACTFALPAVRTCTNADASCDCADPTKNPPLCGATLGQQTRAKAYPTVRELMAVRALGDQGVVASICPTTLQGDRSSAMYGYNPAVKAIVDRVQGALAK